MTVRRHASGRRGPAASGPRLHTKSAQLVDYLRAAIAQGQLSEPLPGSREWSRQLGVGRRTLNTAVAALRRDGLLTVHQRGVRLAPHPARRPARSGPAVPRRVHLVLFQAYRIGIHNYLETMGRLQERLHRRGIELFWEAASPARLRELARRPARPNELLVLASLPPVYQRLFAAARKPVCILGECAPGLHLPFVNVDQSGAVRHAVFRLLQRGARELVFVHVAIDSAGMRSTLAAFRAAAASWTRGPVTTRTVATALDSASLLATSRRLAEAGLVRRGCIVVAPVPVSLVLTTLLRNGVKVPEQTELVALFHSPDAVKLDPMPLHYPFPVDRVVKALADAAELDLRPGASARFEKTIPTELSRAS